MDAIVQAVGIGMFVMLVGTIPPNIIFAAMLLHGHAEWQTSSGAAALVWTAGVDASFVRSAVALLVVAAGMVGAYAALAGAARQALGRPARQK